MKKLLFLISILTLFSCSTQKKKTLIGETDYQQKENLRFKDASKSPLKKHDLRNFKGLDFFPVDNSFIVNATLKLTPDAPIFEMKTTTNRKPFYKSYAIASFNLQGKKHELTIYQDQENLESDTYKDYLFLPFTDNTSGNESYGGGRYMDVFLSKITSDNQIILNFNNTYNPYCAYNDKFSCPITPRKNHLDIEIKAGVKVFEKH